MSQISEWIRLVEWTAWIMGMLGVLLLSTKTRWSGYGFVLFLLGSCLWATDSVVTHASGMLVPQILATLLSLLGIWRWLIAPEIEAYRLKLWEEWMGGHV